MGRKVASLSPLLSKKFVLFSMSSNAYFAPMEPGVNPSRCSRSYFSRASSGLKRAVGGPKRSEGLPYRGPLGTSTKPLMSAVLSTVSDGEPIFLMVFDSAARAAEDERMREMGRGGHQLFMCPKLPSTSAWSSAASTTAQRFVEEVIQGCRLEIGRTLGGDSYNVDLPFYCLVWALWKKRGQSLIRRYHDARVGFADPLVHFVAGLYICSGETRGLQRRSEWKLATVARFTFHSVACSRSPE